MKFDRLAIGKAIAICSLILLIFSAEVIGATYYVAPTGSDSNPGTNTAPFRNIQKAADIVSQGDTVIVKNGNYYDHDSDNWVLEINRGGTSNNIITFRAENIHGAVIDGENQTTGYGIGIKAPYIRIEGFEVKNLYSHGAMVKEGAYEVMFYQNKIHHIGYVDDESQSGHVGIYTSPYVYAVTFDRNILYDIGRNDTGCEHCYRHDQGLYVHGRKIVITNNIFYNFFAGWSVSIRGHYGVAGNTPTHIVTNNTFAHDANPDKEIIGHMNFFVSSGHNRMKNVIVQNNVFYNPNGNSAIRIQCGISPEGTNIIRNNVTDTPYVASEDLGSCVTNYVTLSNNVKSLPLTSFGISDPGKNNFTLTSSSSYMIDKGYAVDAPNHDYKGISRPKNNKYDIGAYEYVDSDQSAEAPGPPEGLRVLQ